MLRLTLILCFLPHLLLAQEELPLGGLLNFSPQANHTQPAYSPDGRVFIAVPLLSRLSFGGSNRFSYKDLFNSGGGITDLLRDRNFFSLQGTIGTFLFGYQTSSRHYISIFSNEKIVSGIVYPANIMRFVLQGNAAFVGKKWSLDIPTMEMVAYREIGVGYALPLGEQVRVGVHAKYLMGMVHFNTMRNAQMDLEIAPYTFKHTINFRNLGLHTNLPIVPNAEEPPIFTDFLGLSNMGVAVDLGATYDINSEVQVGLALRDFGFINWISDPYSYTLKTSEVLIEGINIGTDELASGLTDLQESFALKGEEKPYTWMLHANFIPQVSWKITPIDIVSASSVVYMPSGPAYSTWRVYATMAYMRQLGPFSLSLAAMRYPQNLAAGVSFVWNIAPVQVYGGLNTGLNVKGITDLRAAKLLTFNFGLNIILGQGKFDEFEDEDDWDEDDWDEDDWEDDEDDWDEDEDDWDEDDWEDDEDDWDEEDEDEDDWDEEDEDENDSESDENDWDEDDE